MVDESERRKLHLERRNVTGVCYTRCAVYWCFLSELYIRKRWDVIEPGIESMSAISPFCLATAIPALRFGVIEGLPVQGRDQICDGSTTAVYSWSQDGFISRELLSHTALN